MSNLIPVQLTIQAANAADFKAIVLDIADTLGYLPTSQIPPSTTIVAVDAPAQVPATAPVAPAAYATPPEPAQPYQQAPAASIVPPASPVTPPAAPPVAPPTSVPTVAQSYTMDQLAVAATQLMDAGQDIRPLLAQFGVQALMQLPKEQYGNFATALRQMGARI